MFFSVVNQKENLISFVRRLGYKPLGYTPKNELNCVRSLSSDYPRFHAYIKEEEGKFIFSLHLDQKKPSYEGATAHSGDYDSEIIKEEAERIREMVG